MEEALKHAGYNKSQAAQALGIDRTTLWRKMKKYGF
ncbi:MAG: helix-turn-helix domain-containing protein [Lachnospiraceae bacterium]|nr:helix-turn-helix domain-containing protein [Lachnospiraceae bacterium]